MSRYVRYCHHGSFVWVRVDLKSRHRQYCHCWACARMKPGDRKGNCRVANVLYALCILLGMVLVVSSEDCDVLTGKLKEAGEEPLVVGEVRAEGRGGVVMS